MKKRQGVCWAKVEVPQRLKPEQSAVLNGAAESRAPSRQCFAMLRMPAIVLIAALALVLSACGYHAAGHSRLPTSVQTIAIPAFTNKTTTYRVEQVLTEAVVREFVSRTRYRVVNQESSDADAVLRGTIISSTISPLTYDSTTGRASSALVTIIVRVSLVDRKGKVLFENPNYSFTEQYQISREISSFFQEESPAVDRLSRDFARTLVSNVVEAW